MAIAVAGTLPACAAPARNPSAGFVVRSGVGLFLSDRPYRFDGFNIYAVNSDGGCVPPIDVRTTLPRIGRGQEVFRAYFLQPWATTPQATRDWRRFDATLAAARRAGARVVAVLGNQWAYCDGPAKSLNWWHAGYGTDTEPGNLTPYRQWVADVVARYASNPTVAVWDLVNEGEAREATGACDEATAAATLRSFADDVGGLVHRLDPHHLVTLGTIPGECGSDGADYGALNASPGVDLCDYHDYGNPTIAMGNPDPRNGLAASIGRCTAVGKPLAVLENGIHWRRLAPPTLARRAALFDAKLRAQFAVGVVGELLWDFAPAPQERFDYEIGPADPAVCLLARY